MQTIQITGFALVFFLFTGAIRAEEAHHQSGIATIRTDHLLGQPWEERGGSWRTRLIGSYLTSQLKYDADGNSIPLDQDGRFSSWTLNAFGEYAITDRWMVSALFPLQRSTLQAGLQKDVWTSRGDSNVWLRHRLGNMAGFSPSLALGVKIPGNYPATSGLGDGQVDYDLQAFASKPLAGGHYFSFNAGYRYRSGAVADEFLFGGQVGITPRPAWLLIAAVNGVRGTGSGFQKGSVNGGITVSRSLSGGWGILTSHSRLLSGKNTVDARVWSIGISYR